MFTKNIRKIITTAITNIMVADKADKTLEYWKDFYADGIDIHVEADYGSSEMVWAVTVWTEDAALCRECASPNKDGVWEMDPELVSQLVYDVLNIA